MRLAPVLLAGALTLAGCGKSEPPAESPATADAPASPSEPAAVVPTAAMGEQVFKRCVACHTIDKDGANGIGPNLHAVVGRVVASHAGFSYSGALKAKGGTWDEAALDSFLEAPMKAVPGTRMAFAGIIDPTDRTALILYLRDQSN